MKTIRQGVRTKWLPWQRRLQSNGARNSLHRFCIHKHFLVKW